MFSNRRWAQFALFLNLVGTFALFYSFQATSSKFRLMTVSYENAGGKGERSALCVYGHNMMTATSEGGGSIGFGPCPDWEHSKAAAVVNIEHPFLVTFGFLATLFGFAIQFLAIPNPKTIAQIRKELKFAQAEERLRRSQ